MRIDVREPKTYGVSTGYLSPSLLAASYSDNSKSV